jgi:hypothetical protein
MRLSTQSAGAKLVLLTLLTGTGLVVSATAATVYAAGDTQRHFSERAKRAASVDLVASRQWAVVRRLTDSLVQPLSAEAPLDSVLMAQVVALLARPEEAYAWIPHPPPDTSRAAAMVVYRHWANALPWPSLWGLRSSLSPIPDSHGLPAIEVSRLKRLWKQNEEDADTALMRGDAATALTRARENLSVARHLAWQPIPLEAMVGRVMISDAAKLLDRAALQADQPSLHTAAQRLRQSAQSYLPIPAGAWGATPLRHSAPDDATLLNISRDRSLHPATRVIAMQLLVANTCLSTRDVLFGPSSARRDALDRMIDVTRDVPRVAELQVLWHRTLDRLTDDPASMLRSARVRPPQSESWSAALLRSVVPAKVQARIDYCRLAGA